ncbi:hypothetical protein [Niveibacterium sp. SC-1]|uniref:ComEA family DNA-binding protein n=1 Tax=Niveibacterium sp. SC-1 TaxID=3135646 RepID=UPI00311F8E62
MATTLACLGAVAPALGHPPMAAPEPAGKPAAAKPKPVKSDPALDLNTASRAQLKTLPWIGNAEADRIIAARPYLSKADVVANAGIPVGVYQVIRHRIGVFPKTMPHPKS